MNNRKPLYLLAGGRGSSNQAIFKTIFAETGKASPVIAYVGAANEDDQRFFGFMGAEIKGTGSCVLNQVLLASKKADLAKAREILSAADAVFMAGGDVEAGMEIVQKKGLTDFFRSLFDQGKLFFGVSAGSIMLADQWVRWSDPDDDSTANLFSCLGLAPVICDTHAEEDDWVELKAAILLKDDGAIGYGIPSGACLKVYPDRHTMALGKAVAVFARKGHNVVRQADLVPSR
jgi:cyanophycinase-like exopeptidase